MGHVPEMAAEDEGLIPWEAAEDDEEAEEEDNLEALPLRPASRRRVAAPEVGRMSTRGGGAGRAPMEAVVVVVVGSEDDGTGDEAEPEVEDAGDEAEPEEEEDVVEVTVSDEVADRALALLLRFLRPDTREAIPRQGLALALL